METTQKKLGNPNFKQKWKHGETTHMRVPIALKDQVIKILPLLDNGLTVDELINSKLEQPDTPENLKDVEAVKLKFLKSLKLGSQSSTYKKIEKALTQFIEEVF
jgi:hypothetical protein